MCQNQSRDDSDADLVKDLRIIVRERLVPGTACIIELTFLDGRSKLNGIPFDALMAYDE